MTNQTNQTKAVEVIQADWDAAERAWNGLAHEFLAKDKIGVVTMLAPCFARHRLAHTSPPPDDVVEVVARAIADVNSGDRNPNWPMWKEHARAALSAIRPSAELVDNEVDQIANRAIGGFANDLRRILGEPEDYRLNAAAALFEAAYQKRLIAWSDETRDYWLARVDKALSPQSASAELIEAARPFAREADRWEPKGDAWWPDNVPFPANSLSTIKIGDLRRIRAALRNVDPDLGKIGPGHVCKHGIRWPHACTDCDEAAWKAHSAPPSGSSS